MSLVGPRPLPPARAPDAVRASPSAPGWPYAPESPGLWQISGRSDLPWEEMAVLDLHYVEHHWLGLDLVILAHGPSPPRSPDVPCPVRVA